jgi:hypothetical protein
MRHIVAGGLLLAALLSPVAAAHAAPARAQHAPSSGAVFDPLSLAPDPTVIALATQTTVTAASWTITATADGNGTISPSGAVVVSTGLDQTFTMKPANPCVILDNVRVDGADLGPLTTYTFSRVTSNHTIAASFVDAPDDTIIASAGAGGTISPAGLVSLSCGADLTYTITAGDCHLIGDVLVDGVSQGAVPSYTFKSIHASHTVRANFVAASHSGITASAGAGGTISPAGVVPVDCGSDQTFTITPAGCYQVADVLVDGVPQGALTSYTFTNVLAAHTIVATFAFHPTPVTITASAGSGGTIDPVGAVVVDCGSNQTFAIKHDTCYRVADVIVDGASQGAVTSYTFTNISSAPHTIVASFVASPQYIITASAGPGGTIEPAGAVTVNCGSDQAFTIAPTTCDSIADVVVDGVSQGAVSSYQFTHVGDPHTIVARFIHRVDISVRLPSCAPLSGRRRPTPQGGPMRPYTTYRVDIQGSDDCAQPAAGSVLGNVGSVQTDSSGFIVSSDLPCLDGGTYMLIIDVTGDGHFDPDCDAVGCFQVGFAVATTGIQDVEGTITPDGPSLSWWVTDLSAYRGFLIHRAPEGGDETLVTPGPLSPPTSHPPAQMHWRDASAAPGNRYAYRIEALKAVGSDWYGPVTLSVPAVPEKLALRGATPNPFSGTTRLAVDLPFGAGALRLDVFDIAGRHVRALTRGALTPGQDVVTWDGLDDKGAPVRGGIYIVRLQSALGTSVRHVVKME